jgi:hypothetical protein
MLRELPRDLLMATAMAKSARAYFRDVRTESEADRPLLPLRTSEARFPQGRGCNDHGNAITESLDRGWNFRGGPLSKRSATRNSVTRKSMPS